jgi:hypothetical protein
MLPKIAAISDVVVGVPMDAVLILLVERAVSGREV